MATPEPTSPWLVGGEGTLQPKAGIFQKCLMCPLPPRLSPTPGPLYTHALPACSRLWLFSVEGQGVAFGVLLPLLLSQVGVGVVVAEPWPILIPFPTRAGE